MTDDVKDNELDEETAASAEPDFSPSAAAPAVDDVADDDPHASFNPVAAVEDDLLDPYGVGAPKMGQGDDDDEDEPEEETDDGDVGASEAY